MNNRVPGCTVLVIVVVWFLAALAILAGSGLLIYALAHFLLTH